MKESTDSVLTWNAEASSEDRARWQGEVRRVIALMSRHTEPYSLEVAGVEITVLPNVFSPKYFTDSEWFATEIAALVGRKRFLEIGTGTGVIALLAGLGGADVVATDINPDAVCNARLNFARHGVAGVALEGDVYGPLAGTERFDIIFWNHPFNRGTQPNEQPLALCGFDYEYQALRKYITQADKFLASDGKLLLGTGTFAELSAIQEMASSVDRDFILFNRAQFPLEQGGAALTEFQIYELREKPGRSGVHSDNAIRNPK